MTQIVICSDTHNQHQLLDMPPGDILIHAGDATEHNTHFEFNNFINWFTNLDYKHKLYIPGNHDSLAYRKSRGMVPEIADKFTGNSQILLNRKVTIEGLEIFGAALDGHFHQIPSGLDILITHYPPFGILDEVPPYTKFNDGPHPINLGNNLLLNKIKEVKPKYHIFGHIHEDGCRTARYPDTTFINAALLDEHYVLVNKPITLTL